MKQYIAKQRVYDCVNKKMINPGEAITVPDGCLISYRHLIGNEIESATIEVQETAAVKSKRKKPKKAGD